jgi:Zn-dependent membrane protease YugP
MFFYNLKYLIWVSPAILLMLWAKWRISSTYRRGMDVPAGLSGAAAARHILDTHGLSDVEIEETPGHMSDHYDPSSRVVRLSREVARGRTATAVGIAAHEVGHALQHAQNYGPMVLRSFAVPAAQFGSWAFMGLLLAGMFFSSPKLMMLGVACFGITVVFQLINLPVEFNASTRAKQILTEMGIVDEGEGSRAVRQVLGAAALTYVAATLESLLTLMYYASEFSGNRDSDSA